MKPRIGNIIVADLERRSRKGFEFAKQMLLAEKMEYPKLREALEHYLVNWKDFTYPGLFSLACEAVGGEPDDVVGTQAAMIMMTAAFDIHDDIIDKSETKHEAPTVYGKFGVEMALLLGNAFLLEGFKLLVDSTTKLPKEKGKTTLEKVKGLLFEVGNAHALEIGLRAQKNLAPEAYMKIVEMKSASIEAEMQLGALFGGGKKMEVETLAKIGRILGVLGTLREEFIDIFEAEELRQRLTANDLPLPLLFAMQDNRTKKKIMGIISDPKVTKNQVAKLLDLLFEAKPVVELKGRMQILAEEGRILTERLPKTPALSQLQTTLLFMLEDL